MSGRSRLPSGEQRKASRRHSRRAAPAPTAIEPSWRPGDKVLWNQAIAYFLQSSDEPGVVEVLLGQRRYRVPSRELRPT
jgi:hypothetical protein